MPAGDPNPPTAASCRGSLGGAQGLPGREGLRGGRRRCVSGVRAASGAGAGRLLGPTDWELFPAGRAPGALVVMGK